MARNPTVHSVPSFLQQVCDLRNRWNQQAGTYFEPWFRGQRDSSWPLTPSVYRLELGHAEQSIRRTFQRMGVNFVSEQLPTDDWAWYFVMQHYNAPTRLLDWTDGALLALLFAVSPAKAGAPEITTDASVWMLDPFWLNSEVLGVDAIVPPNSSEAQAYLPALNSGEAALTPTLPISVIPPHIVRRIAVQRGRFTLFGRDPEGLEVVARRKGARLVQFIIKAESINRIRLDLTTAGICETTIFPDLEGLSRELLRYWTEPWESEPGQWTR